MSGDWKAAWLNSPNNPLLFVTEVLGLPDKHAGCPACGAEKCTCPGIEPWQHDALIAIGTNDRVSIRAGHGVGKTALEAWVILWFGLTRFPFKIPVTANSQDQLRDVIWPEVRKWAGKLPKELRDQVEIHAERIMLRDAPEAAFAVARTASKDRPEALQGFHEDNLLFVIEEASGIDEEVFLVAQGALSTPGAKVLMCGNPTRLSGYFYDSHNGLRDRWYTMRVSSEDVPRARGHIEDIVAKYGQDSNAYRVRVQGEFPNAEDDAVISLEMCETAVARKGSVHRLSGIAPIWGVDVARFGDDRSALAKRCANELLEPITFRRQYDTMQVAGWVYQEWQDTPEPLRPAVIMVDVIGIGAGVVDRLNELGLPVRGINVGEAASSKDRFMRLRDEMWFMGRDWLQSGIAILPRDDALIAELISPHYTILSTGKVQVESKQDLKDRGVNSPDLADAFLLTLLGGEHRREDMARKRDRYDGRRRSWRQQDNTWMAN